MKNPVRRLHLGLAVLAAVLIPALVPTPGHAADLATGEVRSFAYEDGIVDLLVAGEPAKVLYERLPGKGKTSACTPGAGLYKGNGKMQCLKSGKEYSCHVWLDVPKQQLTEPETNDC